MKLNKILAALMLLSAVAFAACTKTPNEPDGPVGPTQDDDTTTVDPTTGDSIDWSALGTLPEGCLTIAEAREIAAALESEASTTDYYYVRGYVKKLHSKNTDGITSYGNASFYMSDTKDATDDFLAYQVYALNGAKFTSVDQVAVGDLVVIKCHITNYNGTYETVGKGDGYIYASTNSVLNGGGSGSSTADVSGDGSETNPYSATDVISLNSTKSGNYYVKGYIVGQIAGKSISSGSEFAAPFTPGTDSTTYGTNLLIAASATETNYANCVPVALPSGSIRTALNLPENPTNLGKEVVVYGSLEAYFGQAGVKAVSYAIMDGKEIGLKPGETYDAPAATAVTVAEFIAAPVNSTAEGVWYELTGTIVDNSANGNKFDLTTYGNFDLQDATGSVYVCGLNSTYLPLASATKANNDKKCSSLGLKAGDTITIRGVRAEYSSKVEVLGAYFVSKN